METRLALRSPHSKQPPAWFTLGFPKKSLVYDQSITGSSYGNDLTATGERTFRITRTFVDRAVPGCDDGFDAGVKKYFTHRVRQSVCIGLYRSAK